MALFAPEISYLRELACPLGNGGVRPHYQASGDACGAPDLIRRWYLFIWPFLVPFYLAVHMSGLGQIFTPPDSMSESSLVRLVVGAYARITKPAETLAAPPI
jgi:hypothetical protein